VPEQLPGVEVYVSKWNGKPMSALWVRRHPVVHAGSSLRRFDVALELNRPGNHVKLSSEFDRLLHSASMNPLQPVQVPARRPQIAGPAVAPGRGVDTLYGGY
jgi:hypothetical protein